MCITFCNAILPKSLLLLLLLLLLQYKNFSNNSQVYNVNHLQCHMAATCKKFFRILSPCRCNIYQSLRLSHIHTMQNNYSSNFRTYNMYSNLYWIFFKDTGFFAFFFLCLFFFACNGSAADYYYKGLFLMHGYLFFPFFRFAQFF